MTFVGKLFVLVNVGLSLFWAAAAFALYTPTCRLGLRSSQAGRDDGGRHPEGKGRRDQAGSEQGAPGRGRLEQGTSRRAARPRRSAAGDRTFYAGEFLHNLNKANAENPAHVANRKQTAWR